MIGFARRARKGRKRAAPTHAGFALAAGVLACAPAAAAEVEPLRVTVNWLGPAALLETHIRKGWPATMVIDARCRPDPESGMDPALCYYRGKEIARREFGRYISHRLMDSTDYPPASLPLSAHAPENTITYGDRTYPDLRRPEVRKLAAEQILAELKARPAPIVLHDNMIAGPVVDKLHPFSMEDQCAYLKLLREGTDSLLIANWAGCSGWYSDEDVGLIIDSTDGFLAEVGIHPRMRDDPKLLRRQIDVYRRMLNGGLMVVLQGVNKSIDESQILDEVRYTAAFVLMVRETPDQKCYADWPFWRPPPDWDRWAEELGKPLADVLINPDGTMMRPFEGGVLRMGPPRTVFLLKEKQAAPGN